MSTFSGANGIVLVVVILVIEVLMLEVAEAPLVRTVPTLELLRPLV